MLDGPSSINEIVKLLPGSPGIYQFFDVNSKLIYVGKAKNLHKRVSSYFNRNHYNNNKLRVLVKAVKSIKYIITQSESDALLLENVLIKKHQPKYNILLKDDKTYPWICIKNEPFSRIFSTRNYIEDGSLYFGPYTSGRLLNALMELIRDLYQIRTCKLNLSLSNIKASKYKPCLEYQMGNCLAPCIGLQSEQDYLNSVESIKSILKGNLYDIILQLTHDMNVYAKDFKFEEAQVIKDKLDILNKFQAKSSIVNPKIKDLEVYTIKNRLGIIAVNFLKVNRGTVIQSYNLRIKNSLDEPIPELISTAIAEIRSRLKTNSREIISNVKPAFLMEGTKIGIPQKGDKKSFIDLSIRNLDNYISEILKNENLKNPQLASERILNQVKADLNLDVLPCHIECFDNSNLQGTNPVASCVVFKNAKPSKKDYRHFNVKTVVGPDDFESMREIVSRRYSRILSEKADLPQLIIVDGGKGQLSAAYEILKELQIADKVKIIGIAKRLEEIYFPKDPIPIYLDKRSETLKLIQFLRNEAHRFGITFHRQKRSSSAISSELDSISGIGPKTSEVLLKHAKSVKNLRNYSLSDLEELVGKAKGGMVYKYFCCTKNAEK